MVLVRPKIMPEKLADSELTLYRYFIAANRMRILFDEALTNGASFKRAQASPPETQILLLHTDDYGIFMFYWYSAMYVVIEGYRELGISNQAIDNLLSSDKVHALRLMRNATFHFQKDYLSHKIFEIMRHEDSVSWIRALTKAFSDYYIQKSKQ